MRENNRIHQMTVRSVTSDGNFIEDQESNSLCILGSTRSLPGHSAFNQIW